MERRDKVVPFPAGGGRRGQAWHVLLDDVKRAEPPISARAQELARQVADGTYEVDTRLVAMAIMADSMLGAALSSWH